MKLRQIQHSDEQGGLDWHLDSRRSHAVTIASELTTRAVQHGGTDVDVILALSSARLRIARPRPVWPSGYPSVAARIRRDRPPTIRI